MAEKGGASSAWAVCPPHRDTADQRNQLIRKFVKAGFSVTNNQFVYSGKGTFRQSLLFGIFARVERKKDWAEGKSSQMSQAVYPHLNHSLRRGYPRRVWPWVRRISAAQAIPARTDSWGRSVRYTAGWPSVLHGCPAGFSSSGRGWGGGGRRLAKPTTPAIAEPGLGPATRTQRISPPLTILESHYSQLASLLDLVA